MARNFVAASSQNLLTGSTPVTSAPMTLACWFRPTAINVNYAMIDLSNGTTNERIALLTSVTSTIRAASVHTGSPNIAATTATYSAGVWAHAAAVFASATSRDAYLNGVIGTHNAVSTTPTGINRVGIGQGAVAPGMNGDLAECGLWNVALATADIVALALGVSPLLVRPDALVGYWPLRHGYSPEIDMVSTRTATVTGATIVAHPRVLLPSRRSIIPRAAAAAVLSPYYYQNLIARAA